MPVAALDNWQPVWNAQVSIQHLCVLILNCALALAIYIFVGLILMLWHRETHINPQRNRYTYIHTYIHTCLLLLISMLWHRQAIFESKGDKLSSSAEGRIRTWKSQGTYSPADWMPTHKPTELSRIKLKNLNSTARPYDEWAFSPLDFTAVWLSHLALAIYMFVVVNFDALAQASDIRI